jgi:hypothetical protein
LEDAGNIHSECHQNHRPFLISKTVFLLRRDKVGNYPPTVALRVAEGGENGTQCLGHPVPWGYTGTWTSMLGKSQI